MSIVVQIIYEFCNEICLNDLLFSDMYAIVGMILDVMTMDELRRL